MSAPRRCAGDQKWRVQVRFPAFSDFRAEGRSTRLLIVGLPAHQCELSTSTRCNTSNTIFGNCVGLLGQVVALRECPFTLPTSLSQPEIPAPRWRTDNARQQGMGWGVAPFWAFDSMRPPPQPISCRPPTSHTDGLLGQIQMNHFGPPPARLLCRSNFEQSLHQRRKSWRWAATRYT